METRDMLIGLGVSFLVGIIGAIPFGLLGLLFGGVDAARDIYILQAVLLGGWIPLKFIVDSQIKGGSQLRLPQITLNQATLFVLMFGLAIIIPVMYFTTFTAFLLGALTYSLFGNNLPLALVLALGIQIANMVRGSQREKEMGVNNSVFVRMQDFGTSNINITIDPDTVRRDHPRVDVAPRLYSPEDNLRDGAAAESSEQAPMTLNIDPDSVTEKSDDSQ